MIRRVLAVAGLLLLAPLAQTAHGAGYATKVFERASPSVFSIGVIASDGNARVGSGVAVAPGRIATNFHVVQGASRIYVKQGENSFEATLESSDEKHDLALLRIDRITAPVVAFGSGGKVSVGQSVFAIGSPRGLELSLSEGIVSSLRRTAEGILIQTTAPISPGSSGGGLFDEEGRLVGLTTAQVVSGQNLNFAVPVEWLQYVGVAVPMAASAGADALPATPAAAPAALESAATGIEEKPATTPAPAPAPAPDSAPQGRKDTGSIYFGFALIAVLLLGAKPAIRWLTEYLSRDPEPPAAARKSAIKAAAPDRLVPYRAQARDELKNGNKDADTWLRALEQTGGDEHRATAAYIELRAKSRYRAELDRKWAEAQAAQQTQSPRPR